MHLAPSTDVSRQSGHVWDNGGTICTRRDGTEKKTVSLVANVYVPDRVTMTGKI